MNLLFVTNKSVLSKGPFGGAESSIWLLAERLAVGGHSVHYVAKDRSGSLAPGVTRKKVGAVKVHLLRDIPGASRIPMIRKLNQRRRETYLSQLVLSEQIDLAYCFYELDILQLLNQLSRSLGNMKVTMRMAGMHWFENCMRNPELIPEYEKNFNQLDSVNYISEGLRPMVREGFSKLGMNVSFQHEFIGDIGSSVNRRRTTVYENPPGTPFRIVMATRFSNYQKRHDLLVEALALIDQRLQIEVNMVGDGPRKHEIEKLVRQLGLSDRVKFAPFLSQEDLWREMENSHLLCHATEYEGLGKIIVESMSLGLPVLVSKVPPLDRLVIDGETGFLAENDPKSWSNRIKELMEKPSILGRVSIASVHWAKLHQSPSQNVDLYITAFNEILSKSDH